MPVYMMRRSGSAWGFPWGGIRHSGGEAAVPSLHGKNLLLWDESDLILPSFFCIFFVGSELEGFTGVFSRKKTGGAPSCLEAGTA